MTLRSALAVVGLVAVAWPTAGGAEEPPPTTVPPDTTVVDPTTPPSTTEVPPTTVVEPEPEPDAAPALAAEAEAAPPEGGPRTLTVTPHDDLVHGQTVVLRGRGWPPRQAGMGAAQCITGTTDTRGCGPVSFYDVDAAGNFLGNFRVTVFLDTALGTFDCRIEQCVIGANYTTTAAGARFVPLTFDPAGPDPVRHTAVVDPDSDLVDGQEVTVSGDGFHPYAPDVGNFAVLVQCRLPADDFGDCDDFTAHGTDVDVTGHLETTTFTVSTLLVLGDGSDHDCRTGECVLMVRDGNDTLAEAALVPLGFDPAGPLLAPPTLDASPSTGLVDGDLIEVTGAGWDPQSFVGLSFCRAGPADLGDCGYDDSFFANVDGIGGIEEVVTARTILRTADGDRLDCRVDTCSLVASDNAALRGAIEVPLSFDPAGGLLDMTIVVTPDRGLEDGELVHVEGSGGRPGANQVAYQCLAQATTYLQCDLGSLGGLRSAGPRGRPDPAGETFSGDVRVRRVLHVRGERVDCAIRPCVLAVAEDEINLEARAPLSFTRGTPGGPGGPGVGPITATPTFTG